MKVFFDIGTNRFQGYEELSSKFGVTDEWHKVFVEPNPDFKNDDFLMKKLAAIPNSKLVSAALCCDCKDDQAYLVIENGYHMDQGANIFRQDWAGRPSVKVSVIDFPSLCKDYLDYEWYMKFDCECCEWSCLLQVIEDHHDKIKHIVCEFHHPDPNPDIRETIKKTASKYGIILEDWK